MNKLDTALVTAELTGCGFGLTGAVKEADVVVINTCSVREHAEQRVRSHLGHLKHIKKQRPDLVVAVIGCMAQRLGRRLFDETVVDIVAGPAQLPQLARLIDEAMGKKKKLLAVTENIRKPVADNTALEDFELLYDTADKRLPGQAYLRAMRGCDKFCTYCIVPYVRGPEVSRPPKAIIEQAAKLARAGIKQITLLGQRINAYEYSAGDRTYCLADVLESLSQIDGIEWLKFVTSYPSQKYFDEILAAMASLPKVCPYLHVPAQSGSDKILRAMNRQYTAGEYLDMVAKARDIVPGIAVAGDFIVGFPSENDEDFNETVELVKKARYKNCFVFKYSPRPGTTADKRLEDTIPLEIKKQRNYKLLAVQEKISGELSRNFLGRTVKVLVEGPSKKSHLNPAGGEDNPQLVARTADDYIVVFNGPARLAGQFANVKITKTSPLTLFAQLQ